jgi:ComF family protein
VFSTAGFINLYSGIHDRVAQVKQYVERLRPCQPDLRRLVDRVLDAALPWRCVACGLECEAPGICGTCKAALPWNLLACTRCALPLPANGDSVCGACLARPSRLEYVFCPLLFRFPVNRLMHRFKFQRDRAAGSVLGHLLAGLPAVHGRTAAPDFRPDLLIPVPMHRLRLATRGLNPAWELARQVGATNGLAVATYMLRRSRHTPAQSGLDATSRRRNLKGAFRWRGESLRGREVALVDDVMTTGSTLFECARVLKSAGARRVSALVVARAVNE